MSKEGYRLGDYVQLVDVTTKALELNNLLGFSIQKKFIPSIANTIGTDMSLSKIVQPRQFGYGLVTSCNGDKIAIALYKGDIPAIISRTYSAFEISNELSTDYLMMWFRYPEFDRYARFKLHGIS